MVNVQSFPIHRVEKPIDKKSVSDFLKRYKLPERIGYGWKSLDPDYAKNLISILYQASGETAILKRLYQRHIIPNIKHRDDAMDVGSGVGRLKDIFRGFRNISFVERDRQNIEILSEKIKKDGPRAYIIDYDYSEIDNDSQEFDLKTFNHSIYYFDDWNMLARSAYSTIRKEGSLVFVVNGDEGMSADMIEYIMQKERLDVGRLDIEGFIKQCSDGLDRAQITVYRLPFEISERYDKDLMIHMARIFVEDLQTPIATDVVRKYLESTGNNIGFVDKVIEIKKMA